MPGKKENRNCRKCSTCTVVVVVDPRYISPSDPGPKGRSFSLSLSPRREKWAAHTDTVRGPKYGGGEG